MGLIESAWEQVSPLRLVVLGVLSFLGYTFVSWVIEEAKLRRLPGASHAQFFKARWPFSIDFVVMSIRSNLQYKNLDLFQRLMDQVQGWTGEVRPVGLRAIFTADVENIKAILATQFTDYGKGKVFHDEWHEFLGDSIFTTDGQQWHDSRQLIRPQFVRDRVSDLHCFESHVQTLFRLIANGGALDGEHQEVDVAGGDGKVFDISEVLFRYTMDVATDFLLGHDVKSMTTLKQEFADAFSEVQRVQSILSRANSLKPIVPRRTFRAGLRVVDRTVNEYIDRALRLRPAELASKTKSDSGYTFLHELASFTRDRRVLRDQIVAVLLAGRDTTAATLSWALYELGRHPRVVARLRAEILAAIGPERAPTYADLKGMKYLQNVVNETLRLYPAVPFNVRWSLRDTTLPRGGGPDGTQPLSVLRNTPVGYSVLMMQRRADLYPPPSADFAHHLVFSPERWYAWQPKPWEYIPFNGGPRICIGQQFALTEMTYVLCRLFQRYGRVQNCMADVDGGEPSLRAEIVLQPGQGVRMAFWQAKE